MKKLFAVLFGITFLHLLPVNALADTKSEDLLSKLSSKITSLGNYRVEFIATVEESTVEGEYVVSGDKYFMTVGDIDIISDGKAKYEINHDEMEVMIDNVRTSDKNILSNPTRAFDFAGDNFTHSYWGETLEGGVKCDVIVLQPILKGTGITNIVLAIDKAAGLPVLLKYSAEGLSDDVEIVIKRFEGGVSPDKSSFVFSQRNYPDFEIIDFR